MNDGCEKIFFCLYLKSNTVITTAIIIDVTLRDIILISPGFNFEKKIEWKTFKNIVKGSLQYEGDIAKNDQVENNNDED